MADDELVQTVPGRCARCEADLVPIAWGMPGNELFEAAERGEVFLGGCIVSGHDPEWHCQNCGAKYFTSEVQLVRA